jgi:hypothetical protein
MAIKKKGFNDEPEKFGGTVKEFVELMTPAMRLPFMLVRDRWIIGQMLYVKTTQSGVVITNTPIYQ